VRVAERPTGYSVLSYGHMVNCEPRMSAYAEALRRAVTPGCTVIDLGAGPGIFSILACKYGAGKVIAIDPDVSIELIREFGRANGCADKITVVNGLSTDYSSPSRADVIVSDIRGILPLFEGHIAAIADARERLLSPNGTLIPSRDTLRVALVHNDKEYRPYEEPWLRNKFDVELAAGHRYVANTFAKVNFGPEDLLSQAETLAVLDYNSITDPNVVGGFDLAVEKRGTAHGLLLWFDAELLDGIGFSNAPGAPRQIYGQTLFPLERSVDVVPGDRVAGEISARLIDGSYVWTWRTAIHRQESDDVVEFRQSSFFANLFAPDKLRTRANGFVPPVRAAHEIDRFCLSRVDGRRTVETLAEELRAKFPEAFPDASAALNHVTRLVGHYEVMGN
jgi:Ribosomal protein L11 methyltransferase (PrmA)/Arginine methyltransferase oligomerization subdomain